MESPTHLQVYELPEVAEQALRVCIPRIAAVPLEKSKVGQYLRQSDNQKAYEAIQPFIDTFSTKMFFTVALPQPIHSHLS